jgi:hypothetical protein
VNRNACTFLAGNPEGRRPLGRHKSRWNDYIKRNDGVIWIAFIWLRILRNGGFL